MSKTLSKENKGKEKHSFSGRLLLAYDAATNTVILV